MDLEKIAGHFNRLLGYDSSVYQTLAPHLNGGKILSVGCGEGRVESLIQRDLHADIRGVEITRYKSQKIPIELYNGKRLPFPAKRFDTTLFVYMLHHTEDIPALLGEARRVTKKEILILDHTYTSSLGRWLLSLYDYGVNRAYRMPIPLNFLRIREWTQVFEQCNLRVSEASILSANNVFFKLRVR